jgi:hypothetical protein
MQPAAHAERANRCARMSTTDTAAIPLVIGDRELGDPMPASVNGRRKLTSWRNAKTDHLPVHDSSAAEGGDAAEVPVLEPVGVAFEGDDVGVVDEPVDHGGGDDLVAEDLGSTGRMACWW